MTKLEIVAAMALVALAVIWFMEQRAVQTTATGGGGSITTDTNGSAA